MAQSKIKEINPTVIQVMDNIIRIRKQLNYTQEYMAQELHISPLSYNRLENRQCRIYADRIAEIACVLNVAPTVLWYKNEPPKNEHDCKTHFLLFSLIHILEEIYDRHPQLFKLLEYKLSHLLSSNSYGSTKPQ